MDLAVLLVPLLALWIHTGLLVFFLFLDPTGVLMNFTLNSGMWYS